MNENGTPLFTSQSPSVATLCFAKASSGCAGQRSRFSLNAVRCVERGPAGFARKRCWNRTLDARLAKITPGRKAAFGRRQKKEPVTFGGQSEGENHRRQSLQAVARKTR